MKSILDIPHLDADPRSPFPATNQALAVPNGLLAWGGDLQPERLLNAYRAGIFPWYTENQPLLWWSPAPRCVIFPAEVHVSKRTRRRYNSGQYTLTADQDFGAVIEACAEDRGDRGGTWITSGMLHAYSDLHRLGHAHSVEAWQEGRLAGGIYGLAIGSVFFGESMFTRQADAGKIALIALCKQLECWSFGVLDCQLRNSHLMRMGAREISRQEFEQRLADGVSKTRPSGSWTEVFNPEPRWDPGCGSQLAGDCT
jgi:leucyl/phenylalanyl-tRNA--protein transferase